MAIKPILFNTEMIRAILDWRKTVTRRVVKFLNNRNSQWSGYIPDGAVLYGSNNIPAAKSPYRPGDILYVRETWNFGYIETSDVEGSYDAWFEAWDWRTRGQHSYLNVLSRFWYRADKDDVGDVRIPWRPSIQMPREAARIFLRVTDVRVERLNEVSNIDMESEGISVCLPLNLQKKQFGALWDSTINPADRERYGWAANPWVWVIAFERCEKPEGF